MYETADDFTSYEANRKAEVNFRLAQVTQIKENVPYITYFGEEVESKKGYPFLSSYNPEIGDVVCLCKVNSSWLIMGKIHDKGTETYNRYTLKNPSGGSVQLLKNENTTENYTLQPDKSGKTDLGTSLIKYRNVYATTGTIQTSDRREKSNIHPLPERYYEFFMKLLPKCYQLIDGTSGRSHVGFLSQDIEKAMEECDIDTTEFAGFIKSPIYKKGEIIDYIYGLRYEEFIGILTFVLQDVILFLKEKGYKNG